MLMGWLEQKPLPHRCNTPDYGSLTDPNFGSHSKWACDECYTQWIFIWFEGWLRQAEYDKKLADRDEYAYGVLEATKKRKGLRWF